MHAQRLAIHDCLLNNMDKFKYLMFLDKDEFIIPRKGNDLEDLISQLEDTFDGKTINSYVFKEAHFCPDLQKGLGKTLVKRKEILNLTSMQRSCIKLKKYNIYQHCNIC